MEENLRLIDVVAEVLDARLPESSRNPDIGRMASGKLRLLILTKSDLADEKLTKEWIEAYEAQGIKAIAIDARDKAYAGKIRALIRALSKDKKERDLKRGIKNRPIRAMICGIPNAGKSTLINLLAGKKSAKTGNKPGVTRGKQWIKLEKELELLDTPGLLWPKFEDPLVGMNLAFVGTINDQIINAQELSGAFLAWAGKNYPEKLADRYGLQLPDSFLGDPSQEPAQGGALASHLLLEKIAEKRGMVLSGGVLDLERTAAMVLDEFRTGKLGRMTLESPDRLRRDFENSQKKKTEAGAGSAR